MAATRLTSTAHEKVWGSTRTEPWYENSDGRQIGEIWFAASVPLLVKFLFTSENLSIQVHPEDEYAWQHHQSFGKTEMWYILRAEPDAQIALGLKEPLTEEEFREACKSGEIVDLVKWVPARTGDTFFTPAGTIHAIGGGLTLCEIQQLSDITYRLFDFGRSGRELHLDHGANVSRLDSHDGSVVRRKLSDSRELLVECKYFRTERLTVTGTVSCPHCPLTTLYIVLEGDGIFDGSPFRIGEAWEVQANSDPFEISSSGAVFLVTANPSALRAAEPRP
jgi:mannose-6-phosphate isomerase